MGAVFGGGSRPDNPGATLVRLAAIALVGAIHFRRRALPSRGVIIFIGSVIALPLLQLIPLPPQIWTHMPGRQIAMQSLEMARLPIGWRSTSMSPDGTLNALVSLLPPTAALLCYYGLERDARFRACVVISGLIVANAILGMLQLAGGPDSVLRFYEVTDRSTAVGFFANRNHEAAFLAMGFPIGALLLCWRLHERKARGLQLTLVLLFFTSLMVVVLTTGSRAGLVMAVLAAIVSATLLWRYFDRRHRLVALGVIIFLTGAAIAFAYQLEALRRLGEQNLKTELRFELFPDLWSMALKYFPTGSGFGSFVPLYQIIERSETLGPTYLNHAHCDLLELIIEGGAPGLILLLVFCIWWLRSTWACWTDNQEQRVVERRVGTILTAILLGGSLVDYPLRSPALAMIFGIGCAMMMRRPGRSRDNVGTGLPKRFSGGFALGHASA